MFARCIRGGARNWSQGKMTGYVYGSIRKRSEVALDILRGADRRLSVTVDKNLKLVELWRLFKEQMAAIFAKGRVKKHSAAVCLTVYCYNNSVLFVAPKLIIAQDFVVLWCLKHTAWYTNYMCVYVYKI